MNASDIVEAGDTATFGSWTVEAISGVVTDGNGGEVYLEPRLAKLFYQLGKHPNTLVSRELLIDHIWGDTIVNEESLTKAVSDLRKVLKAHFENPLSIQTIPKRGYKMVLTAPVDKGVIWKTILKYIFWVVLGIILMILVIRGINY
jgi:DNA-binding winged helix-turn-helix (wHTH) protein